MTNSLTVVIPVFNRPGSLSRLLSSIKDTIAGEGAINIIFSVDGNASQEVRDLCASFQWNRGQLQVINRTTQLGLFRHIMECGNLTREHENVLLLEDDLCVAPSIFRYVENALAFYQHEPKVAGISTYSFQFNELCDAPFVPVDDGADIYFLQSASSWGQIWNKRMWDGFMSWYENWKHTEKKINGYLHPTMASWPDSSWKKLFNLYLKLSDLYFVVPRKSYSTNMGDVGTHFRNIRSSHAAPLSLNRNINPRFWSFKDSHAVYDHFFEITPACLVSHCPTLAGLTFEVDLWGQKDLRAMKSNYVLTTQSGYSSKAMFSFGSRHFPPELNAVFNEPGTDIQLIETKDASRNRWRSRRFLNRYRNFFL